MFYIVVGTIVCRYLNLFQNFKINHALNKKNCIYHIIDFGSHYTSMSNGQYRVSILLGKDHDNYKTDFELSFFTGMVELAVIAGHHFFLAFYTRHKIDPLGPLLSQFQTFKDSSAGARYLIFFVLRKFPGPKIKLVF